MANKDMSEWMLFFRQAGVPAGPAASYANTFVDNRIQKSMLMDLTKEYLKEMGIGVMGDVIAILKYAKTAYTKYERDRPALEVLPKPADGKVELKRKTTVTTKLPGETSDQKIASLPYQVGSRMLEHYMRKEGIIDGNDTPTKVKVSTEMAARLGAVPFAGSKKRISSLPDKVEVVPVKRIRKVDPAEEGKYIISMPKGSIPRTQKILQKQAGAGSQGSKSSVFARLGGGNTSTSPAGASVGTETKTNTTGQANVFNRLGGVSTPRPRSVSESSTGSTLEYHGVLKSWPDGQQAEPKVVVTLGGQKAAVPLPKQNLQERLGIQKPLPKQNVQERLGIQKPEVSTTTLTHMDSVTVKPSLHTRLGGQAKAAVNRSNLIQVHISDTAAPTAQSPLQKRLGVQTAPKVNNPGLQQRLGGQFKSPATTVQARLGQQKKVTVTSPQRVQTSAASPAVKLLAAASPTMKKLIITRPTHDIQERLGAKTGKATTPPKKISLADRLGAKVSTVRGKPSTPTSGVISRVSPQSMTMASDRLSMTMASDRVESAGVMKRLGMPVSGTPSSQNKTTFTRLGPQRAEASSPMSFVATNKNRTNIKNRLGIQKAEASSTTPSLGITVTTSGMGKKTVQAVGGTKRKFNRDSNGGFSGSPKKQRTRRKASANSGVFSRLGAAAN